MMTVQANPGKKQDPISKISREKELEGWFKQYSACLANVKLSVQNPVLLGEGRRKTGPKNRNANSIFDIIRTEKPQITLEVGTVPETLEIQPGRVQEKAGRGDSAEQKEVRGWCCKERTER
jgi:hypothetical protein